MRAPRLLATLLGALLLFTPAWSQTTPPSPAADPAKPVKPLPTFSVYLVDFALAQVEGPRPPPVRFAYLHGKKTENLSLENFSISGPFPFNPTTSLEFFKELPLQPGQTEPTRIPLARAAIPEGSQSVLLIAFPSPPGSPLPYHLRTIRTDAAGLPVNHARLVNLSELTVAVNAMKQTHMLAGGNEVTFDYTTESTLTFNIRMAAQVGAKTRLVNSTSFFAQAGTRKILLAYPTNPRGSSWQILEVAQPPPPIVVD